MEVNAQQQALTRKRYNRMAFLYDFMEAPIERLRLAAWRSRLRERITGSKALEVGVGTGKNLPYYPDGVNITAVDLSPRMLERARKKAARLDLNVDLQEMDVQRLNFPENYFDMVFATFVFCSVPDPVAGLKELRRVCKPDGRLILLEHVRPGGSDDRRQHQPPNCGEHPRSRMANPNGSAAYFGYRPLDRSRSHEKSALFLKN